MQKLFIESDYRPSGKPSRPLAMGARSIGHYKVPPGYRDVVRKKDFTQMFWSVAGSGKMKQAGKRCSVGAGVVGLYFPGEVHEVWNDGPEVWEYRWWTMDGALAAPMVNAFGFAKGRLYKAGPPPVALFKRLKAAILDVSADGEFQAGARAYDLLSAAAAAARTALQPAIGRKPSEDFRQRVIEIVHARWNSPRFGVDELADRFGMHRSMFSRRFHAAFGLSPSSYLQRWRIQNALSQLKETPVAVHEVARRCGWDDPNYFARCIRKATGHSPLAFRAGS